MKYKQGDILICSTKEMYGQVNQLLLVNDKYRVNDFIEMSGGKIILDVTHESTNKRIGLVSDRHFIKLDVYRHWKLKQLLN
jgi:hypothetical protein